MSIGTIVLGALFVVILILYIGRRRARLRKESGG
jgi:hypothetical protein